MTSPSAARHGRPRFGRRAAVVSLLALLAGACTNIPGSEVEKPKGRTFVPMVPDSVDDVGFAPSVTIGAEGLPTISYFGFKAKLAEGEIPQARPVGAPFLTTQDGKDAAAVLLAALTPDQIWDRGAVVQVRETPGGLTIPFGPAADPELTALTPARAKGTDVALAGADIHATWTTNTGVWYGLGPNFEVEPVEQTPEAGAPSIVVDGAGSPIIAYTAAGLQPEVRVAERRGEKWRIETVATLSTCGRGCPPDSDAAIVGGEPIVVVADPVTGDLVAAQRSGGTWRTEVVATGATGGAAVTAIGDEVAISFYTASGVSVARGRFGSWSVDEVATVRTATAAKGATNAAVPTTGVSADEQGNLWVTWQDADGVHLASGAEGGFEEIEVSDTEGGVSPSVAVTPDGASVYLAWYDPAEGDLRLGTYSEVTDLLIAAPSPAPSPATGPPPGECGEDGEMVLDVVAQGSAFNPTCLVAPAGEAFTINFDNQDAGITHNVVVATDEASVGDPITKTPDIVGVDQATADVPALDAGDYFFQCTYHPLTMSGVLAAIEAGGNGGSGNGGGGGGGG